MTDYLVDLLMNQHYLLQSFIQSYHFIASFNKPCIYEVEVIAVVDSVGVRKECIC